MFALQDTMVLLTSLLPLHLLTSLFHTSLNCCFYFLLWLHFFIAAQIARVVQPMPFKWTGQLGQQGNNKEIHPTFPSCRHKLYWAMEGDNVVCLWIHTARKDGNKIARKEDWLPSVGCCASHVISSTTPIVGALALATYITGPDFGFFCEVCVVTIYLPPCISCCLYYLLIHSKVVHSTVTLSIEASPMGLRDSLNRFTIFTQPPYSFAAWLATGIMNSGYKIFSTQVCHYKGL